MNLRLILVRCSCPLTYYIVCADMKAHSPRRLYGTPLHRSRRLLFSSALASAVEDSRPRHTSNAVFASSTATSTFQKSSAATIHVLAAPRADSSTVACSRASFDGSDRHHFFPRVVTLFATRASNHAMERTADRCALHL